MQFSKNAKKAQIKNSPFPPKRWLMARCKFYTLIVSAILKLMPESTISIKRAIAPSVVFIVSISGMFCFFSYCFFSAMWCNSRKVSYSVFANRIGGGGGPEHWIPTYTIRGALRKNKATTHPKNDLSK